MFKLYYINKKHNVARCLGTGTNRSNSIKNSKLIILNYLKNTNTIINEQDSLIVEDDLSLRFALDEVVFENDNELFMFSEHLEGLEKYKSIDKSLICDSSVDLRFIYETFDLDHLEPKKIGAYRSRLNTY